MKVEISKIFNTYYIRIKDTHNSCKIILTVISYSVVIKLQTIKR